MGRLTAAAGVSRQIGGYIRVSSNRQRDASNSPASQRQRLKDAGATIFFEDLAVSGFKLEQRRKAAEFQRLQLAIASGQLSRLIATRLDRYARRDAIVLELADHCDRHGVEFLSLASGAVDVSTATGWLNVKMQLVFAEHFSRQLSENVKNGYQGLHRQGIAVCPGSHIPWHLRREPWTRHGVIEGDGWADARHAVEQVMAGRWGLTDVCNFIWPRHKVMRTATAVAQWLQMPALLGHMVRRSGTPEEVIIRDCWPALVTAAEQDQIREQLRRRSRVAKIGANRSVRALSGLCVCGRCSGAMKLAKLKTRIYLRCNALRAACGAPMVPMPIIERQLHEQLGGHLDRLIEQQAEGLKLVTPSPELTAWRRELLAREAIPVEFRQTADQQRIQQLQQLVSTAGNLKGAIDQGELMQLRSRVLDVEGWFNRPEADRNTDLRQLVRSVTVEPETRRIAAVSWVYSEQARQ